MPEKFDAVTEAREFKAEWERKQKQRQAREEEVGDYIDIRLAEFDRACSNTLQRALEVQAQRGMEYGDTWALENMRPTFTEATLSAILLRKSDFDGITMEEIRLIVLAALIDVKDSRVATGDWKLDSVEDGINYRAAYATFREEYEEKRRGH